MINGSGLTIIITCVMCMGSKRLIDYMLLAHHIILCIVQLVLKDLTFQISNNGRTCRVCRRETGEKEAEENEEASECLRRICL